MGPPSAGNRRMTAEDAIAALLICPDSSDPAQPLNFGVPVNGPTRMMKELFLIKCETDPGHHGAFGFEFVPDKFGPLSVDVQEGLERMTDSGQVVQERVLQAEGARIRLSEAGYSAAVNLWTSLSPDVARAFYSIKSRFNEVPYTGLLFYVYSSYPEYAVNSRIRENVLASSR